MLEGETMDGLTAPQDVPVFNGSATPGGDMLDTAVQQFGDRPAVNFMGRRMSYAELGLAADRAAAGLQKLGVGKGMNVGLCLPNCPYFIIMYHAIIKIGATVVNFNPLYTEREIETQAANTDVKVMVTLDLALIQDKIGRLVARKCFKLVVVCRMAEALPPFKAWLFQIFKSSELAHIPPGRPYVEFSTLTSGEEPPVKVEIDPENDIAVLQFTGGTTGTPKAAMLTHANITINVQQALKAFPAFALGEERIMAVLPLFHVFAMTSIMNLGLAVGAEVLLVPRPDIKVMMKMIRNLRPTMLPGVPTLFTALSNAAEAKPGADFSSLKFCISGGAPMPADVQERFERISHSQILEGYGLSETSPVVSFSQPGKSRRGSVGQAVVGTVIEIRDQANPEVILPTGERGEICVRGPQVMRGYYHKPEETTAAFVDGAFRTGDVGYLDADGYLFIVDRIKDLIICGGYNVYPRVIEEAAYLHPAVQDAIAIGVFDKYRGQAPKVFVTLRAGMAATPEEILGFLREHLNKIEVPREVEIRESLPKTLVGKLSKKELVAEEKLKEGK
jgi:long-chain acyl-CoA synthetase